MDPINVKQAVAAAQTYAKDLYSDIENIRLEEVEFVDIFAGHWNVTLSFQLKSDPDFTPLSVRLEEMINPLARVNRRPVHLKVFEVDTFGRVKAMKIRKVNTD